MTSDDQFQQVMAQNFKHHADMSSILTSKPEVVQQSHNSIAIWVVWISVPYLQNVLIKFLTVFLCLNRLLEEGRKLVQNIIISI